MSTASNISKLETVGLVALAGTNPEIEYIFRHALIQEVVYDSILKSERYELHHIAGEVLEKLYANRREELAGRLAEHFWQAGEQQRALEYFLIAAGSAARSYANREAISNYTKALNAADGNPANQAKILRARGTLYEIIGDFQLARTDQEAALEWSRSIQDASGEWQGLINLGMLWAARDYRETGKYYRQALNLARSAGDDQVVAHSLNHLGNYYINDDKPLDSKEYHEEAMSIFQRLEDETGIAETNDLLGMSELLGGNLIAGMDYLTKSSEMFEKLGNRTGLSSSLATLSILTIEHQSDTVVTPHFRVDEAVRQAERACQVAEEIGWRSGQVYSLCNMTLCLVSLGQYDRAIDCITKGTEIVGEIQHHQWTTFISIVNGILHLNLNSFDKAQIYFEKALIMAQQNHSTHWMHVSCGGLASTLINKNQLEEAELLLNKYLPEGTPARTLGQRLGWFAYTELALAKGDTPRAVDIVKRLMEEAVFHSKDDVIVGLWLLRGKVLSILIENEPDAHQKMLLYHEAETLLLAALAEAQSLNYRTKIWRIHQAIWRLYEGQGRTEEAERERQAVKAGVLELSEKISDPELKNIFIQGALGIRTGD